MNILNFPKSIKIRELCPRDGFQNHQEWIPTDTKIEIINSLAAQGFKTMEVTSFVSPKAITQMADAEDVLAAFNAKWSDKVEGIVLVPNIKGAENAIKAGANSLTFAMSASEAHNLANTRRTVEASLHEFKEICGMKKNLRVSLGLGTSFVCPFAGDVCPDNVIRIVDSALEAGAIEVTIADTTGTGNPLQVERTLNILRKRFPTTPMSLHFHDTHGMGLANTLVAMNLGFDSFETSTAGIGGCPFAPGATGNLATEDLVNMAQRMGIETGIDLIKLLEVSRGISKKLNIRLSSHMAATQLGLECKYE